MDDPPPSLETLIARHLEGELGGAATARALASILIEDALAWQAPTVPVSDIRTIVGFTFGNRMQPNGNREPGPVNTALADIVVRLQRVTGASVWAQGEVADAIGDRLAPDVLMPIYPARDENAEPQYLGTAAVVDAILARRPVKLGTVAVVALRDHAWRCVQICQRRGLVAGLPEGWSMPEAYDPASGQPWTRDRLTYLLHELHCRALDRRNSAAVMAQA